MSALIDLTRLPAPQVVESLDYETILAAMLADLQQRDESFSALVESDPAMKVLEVAAYRELLLRQRVNDAARSVMLAYATAGDLDHLAARQNVVRQAGEVDAALRLRVHLGHHQAAAAGSYDLYRFHALSADAGVVQVDVWQAAPGVVKVAVLARQEMPRAEVDDEVAAIGDALFGVHPAPGSAYVVAGPGDAPFASARARVLSDAVRPVGVDVSVVAPDVVPYALAATVVVPPGPDAEQVLAAARAGLATAFAGATRFRIDVHRHALVAALMVPAARNVEISSPASDIARGAGEIAVCTSVVLSVEVRND